MRDRILCIAVFIIVNIASAQTYTYQFTFFDADVSCGQTTTNYGDNFDIEINYANGVPLGYTTTVIAQATEDGFPCYDEDVYTTNLTVNQALCDTFIESYSGCCTDWDMEFIIRPNLSVITPDPGTDNQRETITLEVTPGFDPAVYRWQYFSPVTSDWVLLPSQFQGLSTINVTAEDLFGANASSYYGVSIQFKIELCNGWRPGVFPYIYSFIRAAPGVDDVMEVAESCPERDDGDFTVQFSRALADGEVLKDVGLIRSNGTTAQQLPTVDYNGTTYDWPNNVSAGTYKIRFQSLVGGSLSSIKESGLFTIAEPVPIAFSASGSNLQCFQNGSGTIEINASGGSNSYFYSIDNGNNYAPFTNGSNQLITGLSANNPYLVKVKDDNECVAQN